MKCQLARILDSEWLLWVKDAPPCEGLFESPYIREGEPVEIKADMIELFAVASEQPMLSWHVWLWGGGEVPPEEN